MIKRRDALARQQCNRNDKQYPLEEGGERFLQDQRRWRRSGVCGKLSESEELAEVCLQCASA